MKYRVVLVNDALERNIMVVQEAGDEIVPPFKVYRDPSLVISDEEASPTHQQKILRKKAEVVEYEEPEQARAREEEKAPWVLEDGEQRSFVGRAVSAQLSEDQTSTYYALVVDKGEIRMYKLSKWYRFSPKIQYETLTLEEAEARMQRKTKDQDIWESTTGSDAEEDKEDEIEYREEFDDDDGEMMVQKTERMRRKKLDSSGRDLKKLMKSYERKDSDEHSSDTSPRHGGEEPEPETQAITELDIKMALSSGPLSIKSLIERFKSRFKSNPQNKDTLRALIKRTCIIKTDPDTEEKLLVLRGGTS